MSDNFIYVELGRYVTGGGGGEAGVTLCDRGGGGVKVG